jgi:hypothetical protein
MGEAQQTSPCEHAPEPRNAGSRSEMPFFNSLLKHLLRDHLLKGLGGKFSRGGTGRG